MELRTQMENHRQVICQVIHQVIRLSSAQLWINF